MACPVCPLLDNKCEYDFVLHSIRFDPVLAATHKLALLLLTFRLGTVLLEGMLSLKLTEKGVSQDALASLVLIQTPLEFVVAVAAGAWARTSGFAQPWTYGWLLRLVTGAAILALVQTWPAHASPPWYAFLQLIGASLTLASTVQFTAQGAFFSRIADPSIGGAYLTLLNTIANLGSTAYRPFLYAAVDKTTVRSCVDTAGSILGAAAARESCRTPGQSECKAAGGTCRTDRDGFLFISGCLLALGFALVPSYIKLVRYLEAVPGEKWAVVSRPSSDSRRMKRQAGTEVILAGLADIPNEAHATAIASPRRSARVRTRLEARKSLDRTRGAADVIGLISPPAAGSGAGSARDRGRRD